MTGALLAAPSPARSSSVDDGQQEATPGATTQAAGSAYQRLPLRFEENRGQMDPEVDFVARGPGYTLFLTGTDAVLSMAPRSPRDPGEVVRMGLVGASTGRPGVAADALAGVTNYLLGKDESAWVTGVRGYGKVTYSAVYPGIDLVYYGDEERRVEYDFVVAPGADHSAIRVSFQGQRRLSLSPKGDLVLATGAGDLVQHRPVLYQDIDGERRPVTGNYRLEDGGVGFEVGPYDRSAPLVIDPVLSYSTFLGGSSPDEASAVAVSSTGGFVYVTGKTLSTDFPTASPRDAANAGGTDVFVAKLATNGTGASSLVYATYLGGKIPSGEPPRPPHSQAYFPEARRTYLYPNGIGGDDSGLGIAVDNTTGIAYLTGETTSSDFPTTKNAYDGKCGTRADGKCEYSVYEEPGHTAPESTARVYMAADAFVTALSAAGSELLYSTYLGGSSDQPYTDPDSRQPGVDSGRAIATGGAGMAYVTGSTTSPDFPTTNGSRLTPSMACTDRACATSAPFPDAFLVKIDTTVSQANRAGSLSYASYYDGNCALPSVECSTAGDDAGTGVALAPAGPPGTVYLSGWSGTRRSKSGGFDFAAPPDAFVLKWDTTKPRSYVSKSFGGSRSTLAGGVSVLLGGGARGLEEFPTAFAPAGDRPASVAVADFDGDGDLDFATANNLSDDVSVLLGDPGVPELGAGTATHFAVGDGPTSVAMGDFNGDDDPDLTVTNRESDNVSVLLGSSGGGFTPGGTFAAGDGPTSVAVGDFNADGYRDLAIANAHSGDVSVLIGVASGGFGEPTHLTVGDGPTSVTLGDFNGDGDDDMAVTNAASDNIAVLIGGSGSSFEEATHLATGTAPAGVAVGDFNGDGDQDLVVANAGSDDVSLLLGAAGGAFGVPTNFPAGKNPTSVAVGEWNGDGAPDVVVTNESADMVSLLPGDGSGLGPATASNARTGGGRPTSVRVGDFNGDGVDDVAVANLGQEILASGAEDRAMAIATDPDGNVYVVGRTSSVDLPTTITGLSALQRHRSNPVSSKEVDAFIASFDPSLELVRYAAYLGGGSPKTTASEDDTATGVAVDADGRAVITGYTESDHFDIVDAFQSRPGGAVDAFLARVNPAGTTLEWSSYLGGGPTAGTLANGDDRARGIAVDDEGNAYVAGITVSNDFPTVEAFQEERGGSSDAFVAKIAAAVGTRPQVTGVTPSQGPPGTPVTITGSGFVPGASLHFGDVPVAPSSYIVESTTRIVARTPVPDEPGQAVLVAVRTSGAASPSGSRSRYTYDQGSWSETDPGGEPLDATFTLLHSGRVLAAGGSGMSASASRLYDPKSGTWSAASCSPKSADCPAPLTHPHLKPTATRLTDGSVLVASGTTSEVYNPSSGRWDRSGDLSTERLGHTATLLDGPACQATSGRPHFCGKVLVVGGSSMASAELFDPGGTVPTPDTGAAVPQGRWTPVAPPSIPRTHHTATLLKGPGCGQHCGKVLVVGGDTTRMARPSESLGPSVPDVTLTAELYDPGTGTWAEAPPMTMPRAGHTATQLLDGRVLVAGGRSIPGPEANRSAEVYDPASTDPGKAWRPTGRMRTVRADHTDVALPSGHVLLVGGAEGSGLLTAELYDPHLSGSGGWQPAGVIPASRGTWPAVLISSSAERFAADPERCGQSCGHVLLGSLGVQSAPRAHLYTPAPWVSAMSARSGPAEGGVAVTISGGGFTGGGFSGEPQVLFGRTPGTNAAVSYHEITTVSPAMPSTVSPVRVARHLVGVGTSRVLFTTGGPAAVTDLVAEAVSATDVTLTFSAPGAGGGAGPPARSYLVKQSTSSITAENFDVARSLCAAGCGGYEPAAVGEKLVLDVGGLLPDTRYYYAMKAIDDDGTLGEISNTASALTHAVAPGAVPGLTASAASSHEIDLSFGAAGSNAEGPPPAGEYEIKRSSAPITDAASFEAATAVCEGGTCRLSAERIGDRLTRTVGNLTAETTYHFAVRAKDEAGNFGPISPSVEATTLRAGCLRELPDPAPGQVAYPAGYSLVSLPTGTNPRAHSPLYSWFDQGGGAAYSQHPPDGPVESGRGYWAWGACPRLVDVAGTESSNARFALGAYRASMLGNPSGTGPATLTGHDFAARWDSRLNSGAGGYHISGYRQPEQLAIGEGIWAFSYVATTLSIR